MIIVRCILSLVANNDEDADDWLKAALKPSKGVTVRIVEAERALLDGRSH